uniref:Uncharacterized protein n=1 Tax=Siphoviridae sp. ct5FX1 TaxID=2825335 RepID=A0A8S5UPN8_9CAUD|nr:MAG TPA: hypothetical protein [Siphoviridae sp. ct5FX1]
MVLFRKAENPDLVKFATNFRDIKVSYFKDRTGSYHALAVLKRCQSSTRLNNLSFIKYKAVYRQ